MIDMTFKQIFQSQGVPNTKLSVDGVTNLFADLVKVNKKDRFQLQILIDIGFGKVADAKVTNTIKVGLGHIQSSAMLLQKMRDQVGLRIGIITTLGPTLTNADGLALLRGAGLDS